MSEQNRQGARRPRNVLAPLSGRASHGRSVEQRLFVRFPTVYRLLAAAFMRLPPGSRLRRFLVARSVGQAYAAANRRDFESVLVGWDRASEYRPSRELLPPDLEPSYNGHDGYVRLWRYWLDAFGDIRWDPEEILDLGDKLLVTTRQRGHGSGSGIAVSERVFQLFTFRRGLVVRQEDFLGRSEALQAAGAAAAD